MASGAPAWDVVATPISYASAIRLVGLASAYAGKRSAMADSSERFASR